MDLCTWSVESMVFDRVSLMFLLVATADAFREFTHRKWYEHRMLMTGMVISIFHNFLKESRDEPERDQVLAREVFRELDLRAKCRSPS